MTAMSLPRSSDAELEELSAHECRRLLDEASVGRIAFVVNALPIVFPVNYRLVSDDLGQWILLRTRPGNAIDRAPEQVAFEIDGIDHDRQQGWSVLARGVLHHLDHNEVELMRQRFDPGPWPRQDRTSWLGIKLHTVTGRRLQAAEREWAFSPNAYL